MPAKTLKPLKPAGPAKPLTRAVYAQRIERVVDYLIDHLDGEVDLHRLAEEAFLSPYHFHRIYHGMTGETVAESVRRMRLHRAAVQLISSEMPIATLAADAGYGSVQAFSRAFRAAYHLPPAAYREKQARAARLRAKSRPSHSEANAGYRVEIRRVAAVRVAALRHDGDYMNIGRAFDRLGIWAAGQNLLTADTRTFGIYYDDPAGTPVAKLRADACLPIPEDVVPPAGYRAIYTPAGRCAVLEYVGPYSDLETPYHWLYGTWLPRSGEEPDDQPCFEKYLNDARTTPPAQLRTAIYLPLKA